MRNDPTPVCSYVQAARVAGGEVLRIEPEHPRPLDETPAYVFAGADLARRPTSEALQFGDWLVRRGLITRVELFAALNRARALCCRIGDALVQMELLERACVEDEAAAFSTFAGFQGGEPLAGPNG